LEILVDENHRWSGAHIGCTISSARGRRKSVDSLQVQGDEVGDFSEGKLGVRPKQYPGMQNRPDLRLNAECEQFGIKRRARPDAYPPAPALAFNVGLNIANLLRHGSRLGALVGCTGTTRCRGHHCNIARDSGAVFVRRTSGHSYARALYECRSYCTTVVRESVSYTHLRAHETR